MPWTFAEYSPAGVDLGSPAAVAAFDRNQGTDATRDDALLDRLGVVSGTVHVDLGCGTGALVRAAARRGADAHGVDVSTEMLAHARRQSTAEDVTASWHHAGFLDYRHPAPVDVITCRAALHQLPDFWKQRALLRIADQLRPGGLFYLRDVIFSFPPHQQDAHLEAWLDRVSRPVGEGFERADFETHLREEYSTYSWIMVGMLERAGLTVRSLVCDDPVYAEVVCGRA